MYMNCTQEIYYTLLFLTAGALQPETLVHEIILMDLIRAESVLPKTIGDKKENEFIREVLLLVKRLRDVASIYATACSASFSMKKYSWS